MPLADKVHFYILSVIQFKQMMGRNLIGSVQKFAIPAQPHRKGRFRLYIIGKQPALILQRIQVEWIEFLRYILTYVVRFECIHALPLFIKTHKYTLYIPQSFIRTTARIWF